LDIIKKSKGENSLPYAICLNNKGIIYQTPRPIPAQRNVQLPYQFEGFTAQ
jgi:hypothetical protein